MKHVLCMVWTVQCTMKHVFWMKCTVQWTMNHVLWMEWTVDNEACVVYGVDFGQ